MTARRSALLLVPTLAAALMAAVPAEAAGSSYTRDCRHEAGGVTLRVRLTVHFAAPNSNDIKKISIRATDARESGAFRNAAVRITSGLVKINGPDDQRTTLNKSFRSSPYSTNVGPRSNGKDAARVTTIVTWDLPKKHKASMTCFYVDG